MTALFITMAATMTLLACAAVVLPLLRNRSSGSRRGLAIGLLIALPAATASLYAVLGAPEGLGVSGRSMEQPPSASGATGASELATAIDGLQRKLAANPDDIDGWRLLGRAHKALEQFAEGRAALAQAYQRAPDNVEVMIDYAELIALDNPELRFDGEAMQLLTAARSAQPDNPRGLWFSGVAAYQSGDYAQAASQWQTLQQLLPPGADILPALSERIDDTRRLAGLPPQAQAPSAAGNEANDSSAIDSDSDIALRVRVTLAPELQSKLRNDAVLFVFARAINGPPMPLAVHRLATDALPVEVVLSDADSMIPSMKLSSQARVELMARVSFSGQPTASSGDLEAAPLQVATDDEGMHTLLINQVHP